jgi:cell division protein ZapA
MGQVTVTVAEKIYRIACNDGQEAHLIRLSVELDKKINEMRTAFGEIGDSRLTVMAAITFMDEREEIKARLAAMTADLALLKEDRATIEQSANKTESEIALAIVNAATRMEEIAKRLGGNGE